MRLPRYCCDLNPIELLWGCWKRYIEKYNFNTTKAYFIKLMSTWLKKSHKKLWKKCIEHVKKVENVYWLNDQAIDISLIEDHSYCKLSFLS